MRDPSLRCSKRAPRTLLPRWPSCWIRACVCLTAAWPLGWPRPGLPPLSTAASAARSACCAHPRARVPRSPAEPWQLPRQRAGPARRPCARPLFPAPPPHSPGNSRPPHAPPCLPPGARLLVVDSEAVQEELWALQLRLPAEAYASVLDQLGVVYEWVGGRPGAAPQSELVQLTAARWVQLAGEVAVKGSHVS
jgi:hypothetical protein